MLVQTIRNRRLFAVLCLGFSSGLPLALTGATLQAWFTQSGVNLATIGALSLLGIPYVWKFAWAPLLDKWVPPLLGRRRGWILVTQIILCGLLVSIAHFNPNTAPHVIACIALGIAMASATQDIAFDAYRTDILSPEERGLGSAIYTFAYRIAMLVAGGGALIVADYAGWRITYELMAVLIALTVIITFMAPEEPQQRQGLDFISAIVQPFKNLLTRERIGIILLFVLTYKIGDALALSLMSNFLLRGLGFSLTEVGLAFKTFGLLATIIGSFVGGICLLRLNLFKALLIFGVLQAFSNLMFMLLAMAGKSEALLLSSVFIEAFCSGLSTAAFVAFLMAMCDHRYSATQFACLSALAAVGRVFAGPVASSMVAYLGWSTFFGWTVILSFPGLLLLTLLRRRVSLNAEAII